MSITAGLKGAALALTVACVTSLNSSAATFNEDFSSPPELRGWNIWGQSSLFHWNPSQQWLEVTWDSSHSNSFFRRPLGVILAKTDSFTLGFDLYLLEARIGVNPAKPYSFEVALGFHNSLQAVRESFQRGRGVGHAPNLVEFDYFPEYYHPQDLYSHQATVWPTLISTNGSFNYDGPNAYRELVLPTNTWLRVRMVYDGASRQLATTLRASATPFVTGDEGSTLLQFTTQLLPSFTDYRVDTFAVASYSDSGAGGSLFARGYVDNVTWHVPDAPVQHLHTARAGNGLEVRYLGTAGYWYVVEASEDLRHWTPQQPPMAGTGGWLNWPLEAATPEKRFFRVTATRP
ncbi:hypothetical protein NXS98_15455 [Fontisphaera persica]|uniref:hypothetical protein n=1 Tax=Fontisphaera persica TaxID=2974023 RepID=UPI0024BF2C11|nr:hypothetical protein [Fontisphaera persica]WCJ59094.1 hypothetical protein NXS98_15455 [Fontisphaera persica]